ncbi:MAG: HAMP domain-containing histidine kinase [Acidobacteria bacterium]|nr:HAMP domain-containing histidine kinase [Acidobacteriota bacterium]
MKQSWMTITVTICLLGLLTVFAGTQYYLLNQNGEARRDQLQRRVESDTARMADELDRDLQSLSVSLQGFADLRDAGESSQFSDRFFAWRERSPFPEIIEKAVFVPIDQTDKALVYDIDSRRFIEFESDDSLKNALLLFEKEDPVSQFNADALVIRVKTINRENQPPPTTVTRTPEGLSTFTILQRDRFSGDLFVFLDKKTLTSGIFPALSERYFPDHDFNIVVSTKDNDSELFSLSGPVSEPDARSSIFGVVPAGIAFMATRSSENGEPIKHSIQVSRSNDIRLSKPLIAQGMPLPSNTWMKKEDSKNERAGILELETGDIKIRSTQVLSTSNFSRIADEHWQLKVQHKKGSIAAFVDGETNKSLLLGLAIYLLIGASILAIVLSAVRSKKYAQRQVDFVSSVSHEFRTPLAVIYSAGENLADGIAADAEQVRRYGDLVKSEGRKLSGMVEQILSYAGARSGARKYNFAPCDVEDVIENAVSECSGILRDKGFVFESKVEAGLPIISADRDALSGAIQNLIANAVKYSNGNRSIDLSAEREGNSLKIAVTDRGIGISSKDMKQIFEPFFRSRQVVDAQIHGNGLGLALVRDVVKAHKGSVDAESELGKGSKFTIRLPL